MTKYIQELSNAENDTEIRKYFEYRSAQLAMLGYRQGEIIFDKHCVYAQYMYQNYLFYGIYVRLNSRNQGHFMETYNELRRVHTKTAGQIQGFRIVTLFECDIQDYLIKKNVSYIVHESPHAFNLIEEAYGDRTSERHSIPYMNHIVEGLNIFAKLYQDDLDIRKAMQVYALHPIFQDKSLSDARSSVISKISNEILGLVEEYALVANSYLSTHYFNRLDLVERQILSKSKEVNIALLVDKLQNFSSLDRHFGNSHPNDEILRGYFYNWLSKFVHECYISFEKIEEILTIKSIDRQLGIDAMAELSRIANKEFWALMDQEQHITHDSTNVPITHDSTKIIPTHTDRPIDSAGNYLDE